MARPQAVSVESWAAEGLEEEARVVAGLATADVAVDSEEDSEGMTDSRSEPRLRNRPKLPT